MNDAARRYEEPSIVVAPSKARDRRLLATKRQYYHRDTIVLIRLIDSLTPNGLGLYHIDYLSVRDCGAEPENSATVVELEDVDVGR